MSAIDPDALGRQVGAVFARRLEVLEGYIFGSVARGDAAAHSDVDLAVFVDPAALDRPGFGVEAELTADLMASLGRNDVDLVVLNRAPPLLYHRVLRDGARVFSRDLMATTVREGQALSRYCDYVPQLRKIELASQDRIETGRFGR